MSREERVKDNIGRIAGIVSEKEQLTNIAITGLKNIGYSDLDAKNKVKTIQLLWNIIDSWYRSKVYGGLDNTKVIRLLGMKDSGGTENTL